MTIRSNALALAILSIATMVVGAAAMQGPSPGLLIGAELLKLAAAVLSWRIAVATGDHLALGRAGAVLIGIAGILGLGAILGGVPALAGVITPTALLGLVATGSWGVMLGASARLTVLRWLGGMIAVAAVVTFFVPPAGMIAALAGIAFWFTAARKLPDAGGFLDVSDIQGAAFFGSPDTGSVVMLNLLRFRAVADYSHSPALAPDAPITGRDAYARYMREMEPLLVASGGEVLISGSASHFLIGPADETWDHVLLVRQASKAAFLAFATDPAAQAVTAHRTAALRDSRLLPITAE